MSISGMTLLDERLYGWLLETDDRCFERAFGAYFSIAYPAVVRHLSRLSRWDPAQLEDLAQDALLRFFEKVGRGRREAARTLDEALGQVRPLNWGPLHVRQVATWTGNVAEFRAAALTFRPPSAGADPSSDWKAAVRELAERIPVLQSQGGHLLRFVRLELGWPADGEPGSLVPDPVAEGAGEAGLVAGMTAKTDSALVAEASHPGVMVFVVGTSIVMTTLPRLRVPTNGYLFEIAGTIYIDECKKQGRKKRGGSATTPVDEASAVHPIDQLPDLDDAPEGAGWRVPVGALAEGHMAPSIDPTPDYESVDLFEKFHAYLHRPLDDAIEALQRARVRGRAISEQRKVDSIAEKLSRTMAVLASMGEGYTQEQSAERLGISRNQVKYILELVQEAYQRFAGSTHRTPLQRADRNELHSDT